MRRRTVLTMLLTGVLVLVGSGVATADSGRHGGGNRFPDVIQLPVGFQPEGISIGHGTTFYVGSRVTGEIYRGSVRTGEGATLVPAVTGQFAIGTEVDHRNRLWVAGGGGGSGRVYDTKTGDELGNWRFTTSSDTFVNDVVVTKDAAYFTDSRQKALYVVNIGRGGKLANGFETLKIEGDFRLEPGFNLNGIEASDDGRTLLAVQSNTGLLFKISPRTGNSTKVDLGGTTLPNGDGLLLQGGRTLYVVQNQLKQIAVLKLGRGFDTGTQVDTITNPNFDIPTTVAAYGKSLYAVNARFGVADPGSATYSVVRVDRDR